MVAISKVDVIDKYKKPFELEYEEKKKKIKKTVQRYFCKAGDELTVITKKPEESMVIIIVENKLGERYSMRWNNLEINTFNLDEDKEFDLDGE